MKLLTDEETKSYISSVLSETSLSRDEYIRARDDINSFVQSQKKAYAEYIIGEDEESIIGRGVPGYTRNLLRKEQRERNK